MIRHLAPAPSGYSLEGCTVATVARFPLCIAVNEVNADGATIAAYFEDKNDPDAGALTAWRADIAADPPAPPEEPVADPPAAPVVTTDDLRAQLAKATTVAATKAVLDSLLARLGTA